MPRISPSLVRTARRSSKLLPLLLKTCRSLPSAQQELRWIQSELPIEQWSSAAYQRSVGVPLQYILGSQPFAELEIECRQDVLIPRWETEEWSVKVANEAKKLGKDGGPLKIVDFCTGTGCIAILMAHKIGTRGLVKGFDISDHALKLSERNKQLNGVGNVTFAKGDVFDKEVLKGETFDLVTANPPYITQQDYQGFGTEKSVKLYEPMLALVGGNEFFSALVHNVVLRSQAQGFIFELGYESQFQHTRSLLSDEWNTKLLNDGTGYPRCVVGWKKGSNMQVFEGI